MTTGRGHHPEARVTYHHRPIKGPADYEAEMAEMAGVIDAFLRTNVIAILGNGPGTAEALSEAKRGLTALAASFRSARHAAEAADG